MSIWEPRIRAGSDCLAQCDEMVVGVFHFGCRAQLREVLDSVVIHKEAVFLLKQIVLLQPVVDVSYVISVQAVIVVKIDCQAEVSIFCAFLFEQLIHHLLEHEGELPSVL